MRKIELITIIVFNIFGLPLLIMGIVCLALLKCDITPYFLGQIGMAAALMSLSFGITIEGILLFILAIMEENIVIFLPNIILVPIVLFMVYKGIWDYSDNYTVYIDNFNSSIVIHNGDFLFRRWSNIYEKTSPISVEYVGTFYCDTNVEKNNLVITPYQNGIELSYRNLDKVYLKYVDNHFVEVGYLEDIE